MPHSIVGLWPVGHSYKASSFGLGTRDSNASLWHECMRAVRSTTGNCSLDQGYARQARASCPPGDTRTVVHSVLNLHKFTHILLMPLDEITLLFHSNNKDVPETRRNQFNKWLKSLRARQNNTDVEGTSVDWSSCNNTVASSDLMEIDDSDSGNDDDSSVPAFEEDQAVEREAALSAPPKPFGTRPSSKSLFLSTRAPVSSLLNPRDPSSTSLCLLRSP